MGHFALLLIGGSAGAIESLGEIAHQSYYRMSIDKIGIHMRPLLCLPLLSVGVFGQPLPSSWDATVTVNELRIPFRLEVLGDAQHPTAAFRNGEDRVTSTSATLAGEKLNAEFAHYAGKLELTWKDGAWEGIYTRNKKVFPIRAIAVKPAAAGNTPSIAGNWQIQNNRATGETAWRMVVNQKGSEVSAAVLRIDGDTGTLSGKYRKGSFVLGHFSGARPSMIVLTPQESGGLAVSYNGKPMTAVREDVARARGLPTPADPSHYTTVRDPAEPFHFRFPDINGQMVSDTDAQFQGKVVLVAVGGSWCPNCHDEAPFLMELYRRYHGLGLEIVSLSFEEGDQGKDPQRLRAFIKKYGIEYTVLVSGDPEEVHDKLPQAVNLNTWPATFFLGRDGRVRATHAGFASVATGELHTRLKEDVTGLVEKLLAENVPASH
jgi:peroxiredoxin